MTESQPLAVEGLARPDVGCVAMLPPGQPQWLVDVAHRADAFGSLLEVACAIGTIQRLSHPQPSRKEAARRLAEFRSGRGSGSPGTVWAAALSDHQRATIVDLARVAIDTCTEECERLDDTFCYALQHPDGSRWAAWLAQRDHVWTRRDDLEGAQVVLATATGESDIHLQLAEFDRVGRRLAICGQRTLRSPRAYRVAEVDDTAWWGQHRRGDEASADEWER